MNYLIGKVGRNLVKLLSSDEVVYENISYNPTLYIDYDSDHNLDEECYFKVSEFSQQSFYLDFLVKDFDSKNYQQIDKGDFNKIRYIVSVQDDTFCFQKVTSSMFINKKILNFGENVYLEKSNERFIINSEPDAIYFKSEDVLIFKSLSTISSIFKGIDSLYKEATKEEVDKFLDSDFIVTNDYCEKNVLKPNRKRIALAMNRLDSIEEDEKKLMLEYIKSYCNTLTFDENKRAFKINNDDELKSLLYGIDERFYTTEIKKQKRLANSIILLE